MKMREVVDLALRGCFLWRSNALSSSPSILCAGGGPIVVGWQSWFWLFSYG